MTLITSVKNTHVQGNYAFINCEIDKTVTFEQVHALIEHTFPNKTIDAIYTSDREIVDHSNFEQVKMMANNNQIQFIIGFLETSESLMEESTTQDLSEEIICIYRVGPAVKTLLKCLKVDLQKDEYTSVDEFVDSLPQCNFKTRILELKESGVEVPRSNWLAKKTGIPEEDLQNEVSFILKNYQNIKSCSRCSERLEGVHYECLICPNFHFCPSCEEKNGNQLFHDATHIFAKLTKGNSVNFKDIVRMRRLLNRAACHREKLCGKPDKICNKEKKAAEREKKKTLRNQEKEAKKALRDKEKEDKKKKKFEKKCKKCLPEDIENRLNSLQQTVEQLQNVVLNYQKSAL